MCFGGHKVQEWIVKSKKSLVSSAYFTITQTQEPQNQTQTHPNGDDTRSESSYWTKGSRTQGTLVQHQHTFTRDMVRKLNSFKRKSEEQGNI